MGSIRNQILWPLVAIQVIAVAAITLSATTIAARRAERQIIDRLDGVADALGHASFPFTSSVLARMRGLSGAHFVDYDDQGRISATTLAKPGDLPGWLPTIPRTSQVHSLGGSPTIPVDGARYIAVPLHTSARPSTLLVLYPQASWHQALWEAALPPLALGVATLGFMTSVTGWIAERIGRRIRTVQRQVARIAAGDFAEVDAPGGRDEIQDLALSINQMCAQLREMRRTIRQSERTQVMAQLAAGLAHQLRNSLTGARMSVQLHAKRFSPPENDRSLEVALRQLAMTEEQVRGLLSLGRIERRDPTACDLSALVGEVLLLVGPSCLHAKVTLRSDADEGPVRVMAEASSLRAAVLNLTLNAIEAAGAGGEVGVSATSAGGEAIIEVRDNGAGPPPELADRLTEAFVTSKPEGVGLGLAIAQQVAAEHGGRLSWSRGGGWTRFHLAIPQGVPTPRGPE